MTETGLFAYDLEPSAPLLPPELLAALLLGYDVVLPAWPKPSPWKPLRDAIPRASRCYLAEAGFIVHVKPGCRCR